MAQVIHVRFVNPDNTETIHESFTLASTHGESINLAMSEFSHGVGVIKEITPTNQDQGKFVGSGNITAWRYSYSCTVTDNEEIERDMYAILDCTYPERKSEKRP